MSTTIQQGNIIHTPAKDAFECTAHGYLIVEDQTVKALCTELLMEILEKKKIGAYVGKINMDTLSPDYLCETPGSLSHVRRYRRNEYRS